MAFTKGALRVVRKSAEVWTAEVSFFDCPHCERTNELGMDFTLEEGEAVRCAYCERWVELEAEDTAS